MKVTFEFNLDDPCEKELHMRHVVADKMAALLYELTHTDSPYSKFADLPKEWSNKIMQACIDDGINFEEIYT